MSKEKPETGRPLEKIITNSRDQVFRLSPFPRPFAGSSLGSGDEITKDVWKCSRKNNS